jgi:hypothetical protein
MFISMTRRKSLFAAALLFVVPALVVAKSGETRLRTMLAGGAIDGVTPKGHAEYRAQPGRAQLSVEIENVNLADGTMVDVFVDDTKVGAIQIKAVPEKGGELELNSQDGQAVPSIKAGAVVVVRNGAAAILSGVLN